LSGCTGAFAGIGVLNALAAEYHLPSIVGSPPLGAALGVVVVVGVVAVVGVVVVVVVVVGGGGAGAGAGAGTGPTTPEASDTAEVAPFLFEAFTAIRTVCPTSSELNG
jgi:hypothetical protein